MHRILFILLIIGLIAGPARAGDPFRVYELHLPGSVERWWPADFNGDGRTDLLVAYKPEEADTQVFGLFYQTPKGFSEQPDREFSLPSDAAAFDLAKIDGKPGAEFVFFTPTGVRIRSADAGDASGRQILRTSSIFLTGAQNWVPHWHFVHALNGDGTRYLIVPQVGRYAVYTSSGNGFHLLSVLRAGVEMDNRATPENRFAVGQRVSTQISTPSFRFEDVNRDGLKDILAIFRHSLCVFYQRHPAGFREQPDRVVDMRFDALTTGQESIRKSSEDTNHTRVIGVQDLNADGEIDIVALKTSLREGLLDIRTELQIFYGKPGSGAGRERLGLDRPPDQVIQCNGAQILPDVVDLNHDGRPDLIVPTVHLGLTRLVRILLTQTLDIEVEFYLMGPDGRYPDRPTLRRKVRVAFYFKGYRAGPVYEVADLNGDGLPDILTNLDAYELVGYLGHPKEIVEKRPALKFEVPLPKDGTRVRALELNGDTRADVVIMYDPQDGEDATHLLRVLLSAK